MTFSFQDINELFYRREADLADVHSRTALASRILGTPSPSVAGVVNLDDPSQARSYMESLEVPTDPVQTQQKERTP
jgi:hypothetical protein